MQVLLFITGLFLYCILRDMQPVKTHLCNLIDAGGIYWESNFTMTVLENTLIVEKEIFISRILYLVSEGQQVQAKAAIRECILNIEPRPWFYHLVSFLIFPFQVGIWAFHLVFKRDEE